MDEDTLIRKYFSFDANAKDVSQGPGDDAALLLPTDRYSVVSTDLFLQGAHFDADDDPEGLGHKALAVNLSDLAAMGATPRHFTLALAMPAIDEEWIAGFSRGLQSLANEHEIALVGGDLSQGELGVCITVMGSLEGDSPALCRHEAKVGDMIGVTGTVGDPALARLYPGKAGLEECQQRLHWPQPRVRFGQGIRGHAHAAMDISDGILKDLGRLLKASAVGAEVDLAKIPLSGPVAAERQKTGDWFTLLGGGEDYELVFTAPQAEWATIESVGDGLGVMVTAIGRVDDAAGLRLVDAGNPVPLPEKLGFDHFS